MKDLILRLSKYLGITETVTATIMVTIGVFLLGIIINQLIIAITSYRKRRDHRELCRLSHRFLLIETYKQKDAYASLRDQWVVDHIGAFLYTYKVFASLSMFKDLGYQNLYKAYLGGFENLFVSKNKLKAFTVLWKNIEYINSTYANSLKLSSDFVDRNGEFNEARNMVFGKAQSLIEHFRLNFHGELSSEEPLGVFYKKREEIITRFLSVPNPTNPKNANTYASEILLLNQNNIEILKRYERDIRPVELNTLLLECNLRYQNVVNHVDSAHHYLNALHNSYSESYSALKDSYRILNAPSLNLINEIKQILKNKLIILS